MTVEEAVKGRRSIRKFKTDKIPHEVVKQILSVARWAPSWGNTQPWEFYVLTGEALEEFRNVNHRKMINGENFNTDIPYVEVFPDKLKKR